MKRILSAVTASVVALAAAAHPSEGKVIRISTDNTDLILKVGSNGRLYQTYLGPKLLDDTELSLLDWAQHAGSDGSVSTRGWEAYSASGNEEFFEPALGVTHADGNATTYLYYVDSSVEQVAGGTHTTIRLRDDKYPFDVTLNYTAYPKENVIKTWSEISHNEKKSVTLSAYASAMLYFNEPEYYLTEFSSDWAKEAQMSSQKLQFGKKVIDTKLGSRAAMHTHPFFEIGLNGPVKEHSGEVLMGTLGWTGNFRFIFEVDNVGNLRVIPGINPYASNYELKANETFTTPEFIFTLSYDGTSQGSRNLHEWARKYSLKDGEGSRMTLLNNWENTAFDFDQEILAELMKEAKHLGVDMFLLDDGWFGNKYPRHSDTQGLGDWDETKNKLPNGIGALTDAAKKNGVKFGLWIEPEMVNPKSELYEKHKDWVITLPNRDEYYFRNQLVLDLSNPKVQDYVFDIVDGLKTKYPDIAFFKWDCNSPITNIYSNYEKMDQDHLYVDYVKGLYNVLDRIQAKYPDLLMMMCSGGGGRSDYEGLKYFTEFWPSDNTDPIERLYIQWGFSQIFPAKTLCAHVTTWNRSTPVKFRTNVAMMGKLGFDLKLDDMSKDEVAYCKRAIKNYNSLKPVILEGDQYRLVSPYEGEHAATMYVGKKDGDAVLFTFDIYPRYKQQIAKSESTVKLNGLNPSARYSVTEIDRTDGNDSKIGEYSGEYLMQVGIPLFTLNRLNSRVFSIKKI